MAFLSGDERRLANTTPLLARSNLRGSRRSTSGLRNITPKANECKEECRSTEDGDPPMTSKPHPMRCGKRVLLPGGNGCPGGSAGIAQRDDGPACARGGDPLVVAVREARIEVGLESQGAARDEPASVLLLRLQQVLNAALVGAVGGRNAGHLQGI